MELVRGLQQHQDMIRHCTRYGVWGFYMDLQMDALPFC